MQAWLCLGQLVYKPLKSSQMVAEEDLVSSR